MKWIILLALVSSTMAAILPVPNSHIPTGNWDNALQQTWTGIKQRNMAPWSTGLVHRPKSESPGDAVSEGQGYGMMVALYANDQTTFNSIWQASESYLWNGQALNWRVGPTGSTMGYGAATDADQDVAAMLIFADALVKAGVWKSYTLSNGVGYSTRAQAMLNHIWNTMVDSYGGNYHLKPGDGWGGYNTLNVGYYTPAFYRIFARFDTESTHDWLALADQGYRTLNANPGAALGLAPDWSDGAGQVLPSGPGYNAFDNGHSMYKDAIRVLWRIGTDALWFNTPEAKSFLSKSLAFLDAQGGASAANFYQLDGQKVCGSCVFVFNGTALQRPRQEHSHLTLGMWAAAAAGAGTTSQKQALSDELAKYYTSGNNFFGRATDAASEDTLHNEMYFDQFLAWYGAAMLSGTYSNIIYDLENPPSAVRESNTKPSFHIQTEANTLILIGSTGDSYTVHNIQGQLLAHGILTNNIRISLQGIAIVQVGHFPAQRVVIP